MPLVIASTTDSLAQVEAAANPPPVDAAPPAEGETPQPDSPAPTEGETPPGEPLPSGEDTDDDGETDDGETDGEAAPRQGRAQRRITTLLKRATKAEVERDQARQEAAVALRLLQDRQQTPAQPEQAQPVATDTRPQRAQYATEDAYQDAVLDWRVEQQVAAQLAHRDAQAQQARVAETVQTQKQRWDTRYAQGAQQYDDWDAVVGNPAIQIAPPVQYAIFEAVSDPDNDAGHALLYYLGQHPDEITRLNQMVPTAAARRIGAIQAQLQGGSAQPPAPGVRTPGAPRRPAPPAPVTPVSGSSPGSASVDLERMSPAEFIAYRNKTSRVH